jgi:dUTP pyrophosphatase
MTLEYIKIHGDAKGPAFATPDAACFDLRACFSPEQTIMGYNHINEITSFYTSPDAELTIQPGYRFMIPTGLEFIIPRGFQMKIYPRSGLGYKHGLILANLVGIIDSDYHHPVFILAKNDSSAPVIVRNEDRIAQAEVVPVSPFREFQQVSKRTDTQTERTGGMGSTGVA